MRSGELILQFVITAMILAAVPFLLVGAAAFLLRRFRDSLPGPRRGNRTREERPLSTSVPHLRIRRAGDVPATAYQERRDAAATTQAIQMAFILAFIVYATVVAAVSLNSTVPSTDWESNVATAYATLAPQLLIVLASLHAKPHRKLIVYLTYAVAGPIALLLLGSRAVTLHYLAYAAVIAILPLPALWFLSLRRIRAFLFLLLAILIFIFGLGLLLDLWLPEVTRDAVQVLGARPWLALLGLANIVLGIIVAGALLRRRWRTRVIGLSVAFIGAILINQFANHLPFVVTAASLVALAVLQVFIVWMLFKLLAWLQRSGFVTDEIVQLHLCWASLTLYFALWSILGGRAHLYAPAARQGFVLAFVLLITSMQLLLFFIRMRRPKQAAYRLLLLRVFGGPDEREDLLDILSDTWRRIGVIDLIAASDMASGTLQSPMVEAFVLRRRNEQFIRVEAEVEEKLANRRSTLEGDARYPVNPVYCDPGVWQSVFQRLASGADVMLMDVRGFTEENAGCKLELEYLVEHAKPQRIVLLEDRRTDLQALDRVLGRRDVAILDFDQPSDEEQRALFDLLLTAVHA